MMTVEQTVERAERASEHLKASVEYKGIAKELGAPVAQVVGVLSQRKRRAA